MGEPRGRFLSKAWHKWLESPEGEEMTEGMSRGIYLRNRLERAFLAGAEAGMAYLNRPMHEIQAERNAAPPEQQSVSGSGAPREMKGER